MAELLCSRIDWQETLPDRLVAFTGLTIVVVL